MSTIITKYEKAFTQNYPETARLLADSNFVVHESVGQVSLHGSRGPAQTQRVDSDVDLCLHVELDTEKPKQELDRMFREILDTTLAHWRGPVEVDLAVVFAQHPDGLAHFELTEYDPLVVPRTASGQFALFKTQKWFDGFVDGEEVFLEKMYPCIIIWRKPDG
jgi:hypothetical protein